MKENYAIDPIYKRERRYLSINSVTGFYWDGLSFSGKSASTAALLTEAQKMSLNYVYDNCKFIPTSVCV